MKRIAIMMSGVVLSLLFYTYMAAQLPNLPVRHAIETAQHKTEMLAPDLSIENLQHYRLTTALYYNFQSAGIVEFGRYNPMYFIPSEAGQLVSENVYRETEIF